MDFYSSDDFSYDDLLNEDDSLYEQDDFLDSYEDDSDYYSDQMMMMMNGEKSATIHDSLLNCIQPTITDVWWKFLWPIIFMNLFPCISFSLLSAVNLSKKIRLIIIEFLLITSGYLLLIHHYYRDNYDQLLFLTIVIITSTIIISFLITYKYWQQGLIILWTLHLSLIAINEILIHFNDQQEWIKLRPNLMLLLMKSISYFCEKRVVIEKKDSNINENNLRSVLLEYCSYALHPCTIILGIWHPFIDYSKSLIIKSTEKISRKNIVYSIGSLLLSILFLLLSTCFIDYFFEHIIFEYLDLFVKIFLDDPQSNKSWTFILKIIESYSISIQFHFSHYFICFVGQSMFDLWGFGCQNNLQVTKPMSIEWPRSLVDVVIAWNIPMHQWLKKYVFQILKNNVKNIYLNILATYFISSYLHGFNFQIWTVLLTLGLITQTEFKLRKSLSTMLSACIESRECQYDYYIYENDDNDNYKTVCRNGHSKTKKYFLVRLINLLFTLLALFHLAFLGATFDGQTDVS